MKIRIFALAKELGLDSKELIEHCNAAGVHLKHSALASISPEERDIVMKHLEAQGTVGASQTAAPAVPSRDAGRDLAGKIRTIQTMTPRPQNGRGKSAPEPAVEEPQDSDILEETIAAVADVSTVDEEQTTQPAELQETEEPVGDRPTPTDAPGADRPKRPPVQMGKSNLREMRPIGTVPDSEQRRTTKPPKPKSKPALPSVAAPPSYTPPKSRGPSKAEAPAQKPDIPLSPDFLDQQQSPLKAHLQDTKKRRKKLDEEPLEQEAASSRAGRPGAAPAGDGRRQKRERRVGRDLLVDDSGDGRGQKRGIRRRRAVGQAALKTSAQIELPITIRGLSEALGRPAKDLLNILFQRGEMVTINDNVSEELAVELAMEMGVELEIRHGRDIEEELNAVLAGEESEENLEPRPPIITILGHVDHGKTTMLDTIRKSNVASGEVGGITQHIAAYQVEHNGHKLTFVDTPGHAAFGEMRARGANVTDIVVLVVAADDGVMPQTVECISHARAADVPIVVALNKIDLPGVDEQRVLQGLAKHEILPAEWGGDVEVVRTSGSTGKGIDDLLDTLLITSELQEFRTNPSRPAAGVCLEAFRDEGRGPLAWLVVQTGTLRVGDVVLCGQAYGRIRAIYDDRNAELPEAGPSSPVKVAGLNIVPDAGDQFFVMSDIEEARQTAAQREHRGRTESLSQRKRPRSLQDILESARGGAVQDLPLIIKADTPGSIEALRSELEKLEHPEVRVEIVHSGVGGINESDVSLAHASGAIIIAFHVVAEERARQAAERDGVEIRRYEIIYEVTDTIRLALEGLLIPEKVQVTTGRALVLRTFKISRFGMIAGCRVLNGTIERTSRIRVVRDQTILNEYNIASLKREKDDARDVREGMECGIRLDGFNDVKEGDLFEAYRVDEIKRTLD
nr:translation initiation factor 2 [uncultured bacterium]